MSRWATQRWQIPCNYDTQSRTQHLMQRAEADYEVGSLALNLPILRVVFHHDSRQTPSHAQSPFLIFILALPARFARYISTVSICFEGDNIEMETKSFTLRALVCARTAVALVKSSSYNPDPHVISRSWLI